MRSTLTFAPIRILLLLFSIHLSLLSLAQTGTLSGTVTDFTYKESLAGAGVSVAGFNFGAQCDMNGKYSIRVNPGTYTLKFSYFGYKDSTVSNVTVQEGQVTEVNLEMYEDVMTMDAIELNIAPKTSTETAVISEVKESDQVVSGISSEQITKSQDRDAAQAMQRIPGVTITDNRFILVRGLSERYNTVMINDAISPSTDPERRSFAFDLIPSNLLDRMLVYKSGSAELPGDFAGGVIKIYTKSVPEYNSFFGGLTLGYRAGSTFKNFYSSEGSSTDFLGFDDGYRQLPSDFPMDLQDESNQSVENASKSLPNNFKVEESSSLPDLRLYAGFSRKFFIKNIEAGNLTAVNYSKTYQYLKIERKWYGEFEENKGKSFLQTHYKDDQYSKNVRLGIVSNWSFELTSRSKIEFKNMFNQLGEDETTLRNGVNYEQSANDSLRNYSFKYTSRSIYSGQLSGIHDLKNNKTSYHWVTGFSYFNSSNPDLRRFRTSKEIGTGDPYRLIVPPTATTFDAARFYSNLKEGTLMNSGDLEHRFFDKDMDSVGISLKLGYYLERKSRNFSARWLSYKHKAQSGQYIDSLKPLAPDQWFASQNIDIESGFFLDEGTNPTDTYEAQNLLTAGYVGLLVPYRKFNMATGLRTEYNRQTLQSRDHIKAIEIDNPILSLLPFFNLSYTISKRSLVRGAYSKTVNRPEFREIAPFLFYNFDINADFVGNPDLKTANIHNIDVRWELYPSAGETFSIGAFYKRFNNPIETYINIGADNPIFKLGNATYAENIGVEAELRKSFFELSQLKFIQNMSLVFNGSLIASKVDLGDDVTSQEQTRALQGQSPYVVNAALYYIDEEKGLMVNLIYNIFGRRIFAVGNSINPTVYEMPRHQIDLTLTKEVSKKVGFRVGIQDLLNYKTRMFQDSNADNRITEVDEEFSSFRRGAYYTLGLTFKY